MRASQTQVILRHDGAELVSVILPPGQYTIGRNRDIEIRVDTPLLSRQHARLTIAAEHILLEDLGSSNGTFIDDRAITKVTRLLPGQAVRLGDVEVEINRRPATGAPLDPPDAPAKAARAGPATPAAKRRPPPPPAGLPPKTNLSPRKSAAGWIAGLVTIAALFGVIAWLAWPRQERLTQAEIYNRSLPKTSAPSDPPAIESLTPAPAPVEDKQAAILAPALAALEQMGVKEGARKLTVNSAGGLEVNLSGQPIHSVAPLAGLSISRLDLGGTQVSDLAPLRGMSLHALVIRGCPVSDLEPLRGQPLAELNIGLRDWKKPKDGKTKVSDLSPLRGMPLTRLFLDGTVNPDLAPLVECHSLHVLALPLEARHVEVLRKLSNLTKISWGWPGSDEKMPAPTAFWKEFDAKKATPVTAAHKPATLASTPASTPPPAADVAADGVALTAARQKRRELLAKLQFAEAHAAILEPSLKTQEASDQQELLAKKAEWLANFKSQLIDDLNKNGFPSPISSRTGSTLAGGIVHADEQQLTARSAKGPVAIPWTSLSMDSIFAMGSSFIATDMPPEIAAFRKWQLGVFASFAGKQKEGLALLQEAALLKPVYKSELPDFEATGDAW